MSGLDNECIIMGDFNTNIKCNKNNLLVKGLKNFCNIFSLKQIIRDDTRTTTTSSSIIDLIFVSDHDNISQSEDSYL